MEQAFIASKAKIVELIQEGVCSFDPELVTCLSTDCSKEGMGWMLQQKTCHAFSPQKFKFARREVEFAGFLITKQGIKPAAKYTDSIKNIPTPKNISEVRSWYCTIFISQDFSS